MGDLCGGEEHHPRDKAAGQGQDERDLQGLQPQGRGDRYLVPGKIPQ